MRGKCGTQPLLPGSGAELDEDGVRRVPLSSVTPHVRGGASELRYEKCPLALTKHSSCPGAHAAMALHKSIHTHEGRLALRAEVWSSQAVEAVDLVAVELNRLRESERDRHQK